MNASDDDVVAVMRSFADIAEAFVRIADTLRSMPDVRSVVKPCSMRRETRVGEDHFIVGKGEGFRIEWYADAVFTDGRSLSFSEAVSWHEGEWTIEATVCGVHGNDEEQLIELPTRFAVGSDDLLAEVASQTNQLLESRDSAIRRFSGD